MEEESLQRTIDQLAAFNALAKALTSTLELHEVLEQVMHKVSQMVRPSNWSLLLEDPKTGKLHFEIIVGEGAEKLRDLTIKPGEGIAGTAFLQGATRSVQDVRGDPLFAQRFDEISSYRTRAVVAVPLRFKGRSLGVIELVHGEDEQSFTPEEIQAVQAIAELAAIAIENARNFKRVQELTLTDEHTALFNARHFRAVMDQEVVRAERFKHPLSLLFLDLDRFKSVNDTHGHLVGSAILREVGELLLGCIRQVDLAFRYGGDEFALVLLETDAEGAQQIAERLCDRMRKHRFSGGRDLGLNLTVSVGVATFPDHANTVQGMIEAADQAMYRVKAKGRDGVSRA
jgi:diguanylate cyclase (GGDEF)-like protein